MRPEISVIYDALLYDPVSGSVTWRADRYKVKAGEIAGWKNGSAGYRRIEISGRRVYTQHVAWLFIHGEWPAREIDHIDGNPENNSQHNLRLADRFQNTRNCRVRAHSKSGLKGARFNKKRGVWEARITANKKKMFLGRFKDAQSAHMAYCSAAARLHGEYARFA